MGIIFWKKSASPEYERQLSRGLNLKVNNEDYSQQKMGGDSVFRYLLNAVLIWALTFSTMDCGMSSFGVEYKRGLTMFFLGIFSLLVAFMHLNKLSKILGYIIILAGFSYMVVSLRWVINTGFSRIMNVVMECLENEFDLPIIRRYKLYHDDVEMAVSVCLIIIGLVLALLLNIAVSEYMNPFIVLLVTFPIAQLGIYIDLPPKNSTMALYVAAFTTVVLMRFCGLNRIMVKSENYHFKKDKKGRESVISDFSPKIAASIGPLCMVAIFCATLAVSVVVPDNFTVFYKKTLKRSTNPYVREFAIKGFRMFFDSEGSGGLNKGSIGEVGIIRMDYETDLIVKFVPLSSDRIYLRGYVAGRYTGSHWLNNEVDSRGRIKEDVYEKLLARHENEEKTFFVDYPARILKSRYDRNKESGIISKMTIDMEDGDSMTTYSPYYVIYEDNKDVYNVLTDDEIEPDTSFYDEVKVWHYPYVGLGQDALISSYPKDIIGIKDYFYEKEYYSNIEAAGMLYVPESCKEAVRDFISEYDLEEDDDEIVQKLSKIFRSDYEYTLMPGSTPRGKDYVSYFLQEKKEGFCAHFASASIMIFRELNIPARYAEGYVVDWGEVQDGTVIEENINKWVKLSENSQFDKNKLVPVEVELDDSKAHAWVEIYVKGFGWVPVDVTPPRNEDDEFDYGANGFFGNLDGEERADALVKAATDLFVGGTRLVLIVVAAALTVGVVFLLIRMLRLKRKWRKSFNNEKMSQNLISFFLYIKLLLRAFGSNINNSMIEEEYMRFFAFNVSMDEDLCREATKMLEKAIYSENLSKEDEKACEKVYLILQENAKYLKKRISPIKRFAYMVWYGM